MIKRAAENKTMAGIHRIFTVVGIPFIGLGMGLGGWFFANNYEMFQRTMIGLATQQTETAKLLAVTAERLERLSGDVKDSNERIRRIEDYLFIEKRK